jgi:hypothetical protein
MAQFTLNWFAAPVMVNPNSVGQRALYRQKSVGGSFASTGFTPTNDLSIVAQTTTSPNLGVNRIWEFKVQAICADGGPTDNNNGVIEAMKFACIIPTVVHGATESTVTINKLGLDLTKAEFTLRLDSNDAIVFGPVTSMPVGNGISATATGLNGNTDYYWEYKLYSTVNGIEIISTATNQVNSLCGPYTFTTDPNEPDLVWIAGAKSCEKGGGFGIIKNITGIYSPTKLWYDPITTKTFVADNDALPGNVYWFNQSTATVAGDMTYSTAVNSRYMYNAIIDSTNRKIYFVGMSTGGLLVYDIDTDTTSVVAYGTNAAFSRITLEMFGNTILCNDSTLNIVLISRSSLTVTNTIPFSGIPNPSRFNEAVGYASNGTVYYVHGGSSGNFPSVGVYNSTFTSNITDITLPGALVFEGGKYWQNAFFDPISTNLYVGDNGSNIRYTIDTNTNTVTHQEEYMNLEGKAHAIYRWTTHPITGELFCLVSLQNNSSDNSPIRRTYKQNRTTQAFEQMYKDEYFSNLVPVNGTDRVIGSSSGGTFWDGQTSPDGSITVLSSSTGTSNTGTQIVNTLVEIDAANGNTPTGNTKPNTFGDPDYIAPVTNTTDCSVTTSLTCPADIITTFDDPTLYFEFTIDSSVKNNSNVNKVRVTAYDTDANAVEGTPIVFNSPLGLYFSGNFTGLTQTNYSIKVEYLNSSNSVQATCTPA